MTLFHAHITRRLALAAVLAVSARGSRAEQAFVGILEADSYQSVIYGASAFSRVADLPIALEVINATLMKTLALPSFTGVSSTDTMRVVQTVDPALPLTDSNPANVAIMPLSDTGATVLRSFSTAYATRSQSGSITLFEQPNDTNLAARVAVAVTGRFLLTSTSRAALVWAWENRTRLIDAPPQTIAGTLRVLVNPQRLADVLGTRSEKAASVVNLADPRFRNLLLLAHAGRSGNHTHPARQACRRKRTSVASGRLAPPCLAPLERASRKRLLRLSVSLRHL